MWVACQLQHSLARYGVSHGVQYTLSPLATFAVEHASQSHVCINYCGCLNQIMGPPSFHIQSEYPSSKNVRTWKREYGDVISTWVHHVHLFHLVVSNLRPISAQGVHGDEKFMSFFIRLLSQCTWQLASIKSMYGSSWWPTSSERSSSSEYRRVSSDATGAMVAMLDTSSPEAALKISLVSHTGTEHYSLRSWTRRPGNMLDI